MGPKKIFSQDGGDEWGQALRCGSEIHPLHIDGLGLRAQINKPAFASEDPSKVL